MESTFPHVFQKLYQLSRDPPFFSFTMACKNQLEPASEPCRRSPETLGERLFPLNQSEGWSEQGLVNVPIKHHPTLGDMISNRYLKVMFNKSPKRDINRNPCRIWVGTSRMEKIWDVIDVKIEMGSQDWDDALGVLEE